MIKAQQITLRRHTQVLLRTTLYHFDIPRVLLRILIMACIVCADPKLAFASNNVEYICKCRDCVTINIIDYTGPCHEFYMFCTSISSKKSSATCTNNAGGSRGSLEAICSSIDTNEAPVTTLGAPSATNVNNNSSQLDFACKTYCRHYNCSSFIPTDRSAFRNASTPTSNGNANAISTTITISNSSGTISSNTRSRTDNEMIALSAFVPILTVILIALVLIYRKWIARITLILQHPRRKQLDLIAASIWTSSF